MAAWSRPGKGSGIDELCAGLGSRDIELAGEHLHYDRAARAWRSHAELAETPAGGLFDGGLAASTALDATRAGTR
ncbi:MAG TPA: hypothetical protein VGQ42_10700 [Candidatus Dormibacteraeota bacterium]|jgi:hypothetical protein|nr:hypothetical protein [Candidatus Dormibacteraeota bacterium]